MTTSKPTEHKSVQARILKYAQDIGWKYVQQSEAEESRGFDPSGIYPREKSKNASRFFTDILFEKVKEFNPKFKDSKEENREFNLVLINYEEPGKNVYEVTEEYYLFNGQYANRDKRREMPVVWGEDSDCWGLIFGINKIAEAEAGVTKRKKI